MKSIFKTFALSAGLNLLIFSAGCGTETADLNNANTANSNANAESEAAENFTNDQIDNLVAPIALYPDPLLAQMLPASTFPDDVSNAATYFRANGDKGLDDQDWPVSVKSVAHYPDALYYMADNPDWTTSLGQAYALQPVDVMDGIQRLRLRARDAGVLETTREQEVLVEGNVLRIYPAQPERMYVPRYDPQEVYYERNNNDGGGLVSKLVTFGAAAATGIWLNQLFDWGDDRVYYHGWQDDDPWVSRTRDHYRWDDNYYRDSYYVDDRWRDVSINRDVIYRPVRYDRITIYDRIFPRVTYRNRRYKEVPGRGDEMRRQDPGRPVEKGPPPGLRKKDGAPGGPPAGRPDDRGRGKPDNKGKGRPPKSGGPDKKGGPPSDKGKGRGN
ncbi:MAG TPA: DUF3300 domain-containing protein [Aridibacter sp.]|nr:DUF3300 domain-containing protein [Aridibacter sp.]